MFFSALNNHVQFILANRQFNLHIQRGSKLSGTFGDFLHFCRYNIILHCGNTDPLLVSLVVSPWKHQTQIGVSTEHHYTGAVCCFLCIVNLIINSYFSLKAYKLSLFLIGLCWTFRPLLQIFMCVEHYLAVIHPVIFLRYKGIQYRIALVAVSLANWNGHRLEAPFHQSTIFSR